MQSNDFLRKKKIFVAPQNHYKRESGIQHYLNLSCMDVPPSLVRPEDEAYPPLCSTLNILCSLCRAAKPSNSSEDAKSSTFYACLLCTDYYLCTQCFSARVQEHEHHASAFDTDLSVANSRRSSAPSGVSGDDAAAGERRSTLSTRASATSPLKLAGETGEDKYIHKKIITMGWGGVGWKGGGQI